MRDRGRALFALAGPGQHVVGLDFDSLLDAPGGVEAVLRLVRFTEDAVCAAITVRSHPETGSFDADVEIAPPGRYTVTARHTDGRAVTFDTDRVGHGTITGIRSGLVTFAVRAAGDPHDGWRTAWLRY